MKSKKLKKIIEDSVRKAYENTHMLKSEASTEVDLAEYNPEISEKFKSLVLNIVNYRNNVNINITSYQITISCESVKNIKSQKTNQYGEDEYLEISIRKGVGFWLNNGYKLRSNYKDENMYDDLFPEISEKLKKINSDNFEQVWSKIMKESGIIRDSNLDEILK
jgi:hypothetical protein